MMGNNVKNRSIRTLIISFLIIFSPSYAQVHQTNLSFDSLFPATWYQKGLELSLSVWQTLANACDKNDDISLSCDLLLGRLALAQFCINRMIQEGVMCLPEDSAYFVMVLNKVQGLIAMVAVGSKTQDFVMCAGDIIEVMQKLLSSL